MGGHGKRDQKSKEVNLRLGLSKNPFITTEFDTPNKGNC